MQVNHKALHMLFFALGPYMYTKMSSYTSAKEVWDTLETTYEGTNDVKETKIGLLNLSYKNFKMELDENVTKMFDHFSVIVNGLKGLGEVIPEYKVVRKLLYSLPESWDSKRIAITEAKDLKTLKLNALMGSLLTHEIMKQGREEETKREEKKLEKNEVEKKKIGIALKASQEESDSSGEEDDEEMAMLAKRFTRSECPQLKKKRFGKKKKLKAQIATWSNEESSDEEEQEVANLCLMALEEDSKVTSKSFHIDLTYNELLEEYEELQEEVGDLKASLSKVGKNKFEKPSSSKPNYSKRNFNGYKQRGSNKTSKGKRVRSVWVPKELITSNNISVIATWIPKGTKGEHCYKAKALCANLWYLDSGCSRHMTGDKSRFLELKPKSGGIVTFGILETNGGEQSSKVDEMPTKEEAQDPPLESLKDMSLEEMNVSYPRELKYGKGGTKWVFRNKLDESGNIVRNKARLVAQGYTQEEGIDFDETYAPVARMEAIRMLLAFACHHEFKLFQMDVKSVFLNGFISEEVYVEQPLGFENLNFPNHVFKLCKALYGLKQAHRAWYERYGLKQAHRACYTKESLCQDFAKLMQGEFEMSMMGELSFFLGLQIKQRKDDTFINQAKYIKEKLKKFVLENVKPQATPMSSSSKLDKDEGGKCVDSKLYRSMIGSLLYLTASRPDIMFSVCLCARFQANRKESHLKAVKRIFRYLKDTPSLGLWYPRDSTFDLHAYSNADYGGCKIDRKSTSGTCQFLGNVLISWFSKKQNSVALSTTEAEYISAGSCCAQVLWMKL
ncbi:hypothetical protein V6N11_082643 [Hibiscus sabdariffa]|uniref:Reverse transcriptase Ty1/copia-type domain-containing protein n=1 Tax=Hibiscus sabdariffa TaxID=183260 RepID=A0ABR2P9N7_9ROSI